MDTKLVVHCAGGRLLNGHSADFFPSPELFQVDEPETPYPSGYSPGRRVFFLFPAAAEDRDERIRVVL